MAVQFASVQTTNGLSADAGTIVITKPTSLAVGDLMVAHIFYQRAATMTPLTGWYNLAGTVDSATTVDDTQAMKASVQYKVADAGDVAASNFTWTFTVDTTVARGGAIYRIIGQDLDTPIGASNQTLAVGSATPSFAIGITPPVANSLLLMLATSSEEGTAHASQAIVTSNPTWTENYDLAGAAGRVMSGATATRPQTTDTGNASFAVTTGTAGTDSTCFLIAISPEPEPVLTPSAITVTVSVPAPSLTVPYTATPNAITVTVSIPSPTLTSTDNPWSNQNKNSSIWTNQDKI